MTDTTTVINIIDGNQNPQKLGATTDGANLYPQNVLRTLDGNQVGSEYPLPVSDSVMGTVADAAWTSGSGTVVALLKAVATNITGVEGSLGGSTAANQTIANTSLATIVTNTTGLATSALQTGGNTSLETIASNTNTANTSLGTIATAQGAAGTGIGQPTGGTGLLGFLSGIYKALIGTLTVTDVAAENSLATIVSNTDRLTGTLSVSTNAGLITPVAPSGACMIETGGTAQVLATAGTATHGGLILNPSSAAQQGISTAESLFVNFTGGEAVASAGGQSFEILPGGTLTIPGGLSTSISVIASTTGHTFTAAIW